MNKLKARTMYDNASSKVGKVGKPPKFSDVDSTMFLRSYCHAVFVSGFKYVVVRKHFPAITKVFKDFDLDALAKLKRVDMDALPIKNRRKATGFLKGAKAIAEEGFDHFKTRLKNDGTNVLQELPWIGPKNETFLAMMIGLKDAAKPDVWLTRCAEACSTDVDTLASYLSEEYGQSKRHVDNVLWQYCKDFQKIPPTSKVDG